MELDYSFEAMGSRIRLLIGDRLLPTLPPPLEAADRERAFVWSFSDRLSRFRADSELTALNRDRRATVPASRLLRAAVGAGLWAAERSGGLVDPTLTRQLERNGYRRTLEDAEPASLREALAHAPPRRPARPDPTEGWRRVAVDDETRTITRPRGLMLDTGGAGKGLCADAVALHLAGYSCFVVDCGGDIAVGGIGARIDPYRVVVEHPLTGDSIGRLEVAGGGIATSGLNVRIWRRPDGRFAHHLLDPSTGAPVWSGLIGATAVAAGALEAETLSKMALLLGPAGAREVLSEHGGVIVHDDGEVEWIAAAGRRAPERPSAKR
jgi:thiamine biosynthesis lipoprotein